MSDNTGYTVPTENGPPKKITRTIKEDGHPILNRMMFVENAQMRIQAARALLEEKDEKQLILADLENNLIAFFYDRASKEKQKEFEGAKKKYIEAKKENSETETGVKDFAKFETIEKEFNAAFDKYYQFNLEKLEKINLLLARCVDPKKSPKSVMKKIDEKANELRAKQPRPIQENNYEYNGLKVSTSHTPEGKLSKEQKKSYKEVFEKDLPEGQLHTSPSTIRDERQVGQTNAVRSEIKINKDEESAQVVFSGHRHGSPSVLEIEDDAERQYRTMQNVRQTLAVIAEEKLQSLSAADRAEVLKGTKTLELDMATMSLLSPIFDAVDEMKQYRQVDDSRQAYWSLQGREVDLELPDHGENTEKKIKIKLNSSFMTMGVNAARGIGTSDSLRLVDRVNERGLNNLIDTFMKSCKSEQGSASRLVLTIKNIEISSAIQECKDKLKEYDVVSLQRLYKELEIDNKEIYDYARRDECQDERKSFKNHRSGLLKKIKEEEKVLSKLHKDLASARKKAYKEALPALKEVAKKANINRNNENFQKMQLFINTLDSYYNQPKPGLLRLIKQLRLSDLKKKALKKSNHKKAAHFQERLDKLNDGNYHFQTRFALLAYSMDNAVEWFCKSGEDRTGLLNEHIEAYCIFKEKHGHFPVKGNAEDEKKFYAIMPHVHNGSPNNTTNAANDGSPGMDVKDHDIKMPGFSYYRDKVFSGMREKSSEFKGQNKPLSKEKANELMGEMGITLPADLKKEETQSRDVLPSHSPGLLFRLGQMFSGVHSENTTENSPESPSQGNRTKPN